MPQYRLRFFRGPTPAGQDRIVDLPDDEAAFAMGKQICAAFGRDERLDAASAADMRVEIFAANGRMLFRVAATVEILDGVPIRQKPRIVN